MNTPLTLHDIIIQITIWTLIDSIIKTILFTATITLTFILCLLALKANPSPRAKLPKNQEKPKIPTSAIVESILLLPLVSIFTYISITVFGFENLDITQYFLPEKFVALIIFIIVVTVIHISIFTLAVGSIPVNKDSLPEEQNDPTKKIDDLKNKTLISIFLQHSKILISLSTILAIVAYASVLRSNLAPTDGDLGMALQITSLQFSENKFKWIAQLSIFTTLIYLIIAPALLIWSIKEYIESNNSYPIIKSINTSDPIDLCKALIYSSIIITSITNICNAIIILPTMKDGIIPFLTSFPFISLILCSLPITLTINKNFTYRPNPQKDESQNDEPKNTESTTAPYQIFIILVLLLFIGGAPKIFLEYLPYSLGKSIANPGETLGSSGIVYDCIFTADPTIRESTAFGIIAASKPESIHIFTPAYDHASSSYGKRTDEGGIDLNKLTETQIKISGGYRIEKFDNDKHEYDLISGKCIYKNSPFYLHTYSWNTPNIN